MNQRKIGAFIAELRKEKKLTQAELGAQLGVTNKTVSRWENGNYMPDLSSIPLLCDALGISVNELFCGERLGDGDFRREADSNMISVLNREQTMLREKKISDFLSGAGTGVLISALYSPDTMRRTIIIFAGISMILGGWYFRSRLDRHILRR